MQLADGWLTVSGTKTAAAERRVYLLPLRRDELAAHAASRRGDDPAALVFPTSSGGQMATTNARRRVLAPAVALANEALDEHGAEPLPEG